MNKLTHNYQSRMPNAEHVLFSPVDESSLELHLNDEQENKFAIKGRLYEKDLSKAQRELVAGLAYIEMSQTVAQGMPERCNGNAWLAAFADLNRKAVKGETVKLLSRINEAYELRSNKSVYGRDRMPGINHDPSSDSTKLHFLAQPRDAVFGQSSPRWIANFPSAVVMITQYLHAQQNVDHFAVNLVKSAFGSMNNLLMGRPVVFGCTCQEKGFGMHEKCCVRPFNNFFGRESDNQHISLLDRDQQPNELAQMDVPCFDQDLFKCMTLFHHEDVDLAEPTHHLFLASSNPCQEDGRSSQVKVMDLLVNSTGFMKRNPLKFSCLVDTFPNWTKDPTQLYDMFTALYPLERVRFGNDIFSTEVLERLRLADNQPEKVKKIPASLW